MAGEGEPRRRLRWRHLWAVPALLAVAAFVPTPQPDVKPGPLWEQTEVLRGATPTSSSHERGTPYAPLGVVALQYLGLDIGPDPSGSTTDREFVFDDLATARAAANDAVRTAIRLGYDMQSAQWGGGVWQMDSTTWGDDGSSPDGTMLFSVWTSEEPGSGEYTVRLLLEHFY